MLPVISEKGCWIDIGVSYILLAGSWLLTSHTGFAMLNVRIREQRFVSTYWTGFLKCVLVKIKYDVDVKLFSTCIYRYINCFVVLFVLHC